MKTWLIVAAGGAVGSLLRYGVGQAAIRLAPGAAWPWGTFVVNAIGGLLIGAAAGWLAWRGQGGDGLRLFVIVGLLGGFTTFSAFSLETALMIERRQAGLALAYAGLSVLICVAAVFIGLWLTRRLLA